MLPNASFAVTTTLNEVPAVCVVPAGLTWRVAAAAGLTVIPAVVPLIEPVTVSVAVTVCEPAVFSVTAEEKVWVPLSPATKV